MRNFSIFFSLGCLISFIVEYLSHKIHCISWRENISEFFLKFIWICPKFGPRFQRHDRVIRRNSEKKKQINSGQFRKFEVFLWNILKSFVFFFRNFHELLERSENAVKKRANSNRIPLYMEINVSTKVDTRLFELITKHKLFNDVLYSITSVACRNYNFLFLFMYFCLLSAVTCRDS